MYTRSYKLEKAIVVCDGEESTVALDYFLGRFEVIRTARHAEVPTDASIGVTSAKLFTWDFQNDYRDIFVNLFKPIKVVMESMKVTVRDKYFQEFQKKLLFYLNMEPTMSL